MIDLKKREELERVATRGPWFAGRQPCLSSVVVCEVSKSNLVTTYADGGKSHGYQDTNLIAYYRNDAAEVNDWIRAALPYLREAHRESIQRGCEDMMVRRLVEQVKL